MCSTCTEWLPVQRGKQRPSYRLRARAAPVLIGYMRVSSSDDRQVVDLQLDALLAAGVGERQLHQDKQSGGRDDRAGLKTCLAGLRAGDVLVVWKLDRLGRSLSHLSLHPG